MAATRVGPSVGSARNREHEVGDAVALDACRRVAEHDVFGGELAEEGPVSLAEPEGLSDGCGIGTIGSGPAA